MPEMPTQQRMGEASSGQSRQTSLRQPPSGQSTPQSTLGKSGDNPPPVKICTKGEKDDLQRKTDIWNLPKETKKKENKSSKCGDTFLKMYLKLIEKPDNKNESESSLTDGNGHIESFAYNSTTNFTPTQHENGNEILDSTNAFNQTMFNQLMEFYDIYKFETRIFTCSFAISQLALLACRLSMQQFSFALPLILTPLLSIIAVSLSCNNFLESTQITVGIDLTCSMPEGNERNIFIASGALAWIAVIALTWYIWVPRVERMAKLERLFSGSFYDFFFPDLNMLLRRRNDHQIREQHMDSVQPRDVPKVIICVTMWHETCQEMCQLLKSICRLDLHLSIREEADHIEEDKNGADGEKQDAVKKTQDPDKINIEVQIVFDDAFCSTKNGCEVNEYLLQFMSCLQKAVGSVLKDKELLEWNKTFQKKVVQTPYGGQFILQLPGGTQMTIHLKDKKKIRPRKRWSQVMYMYYCLLYKMGKMYPDTIRDELKKTFILTLDGDVDFEPKSVLRLMDRMKMNSRVAAVCGRIHPIGTGPMVWYQQFEYAVGHWLQKACEHIFGSVLCCPGCFSIFRASALVDDNVLKTYTKEPDEGKHLLQFEQGEDRWLCTLLIKRGYKTDYCAAADAKTFAPENFWDFFVQRRRWSPSTMANLIDLVLSWKQIVQNNREINHMFMIYQLVLVITSVLAPGIVLVMIAGSFSSVLSLKPWHSFFVAVTPVERQQSEQHVEMINYEDDRRAKTKAQEFQEHLKEIELDLEEDEEEDEPPPDYMSEPDVDYDDFDCETVLDTASPSPNRPNSRKFNIYHHRIQTVRYRKQHRQPIDASLYHLDGGYVGGSFLRPGVKYPSNIFHEDRRG
ncbi:chitin synthase chs-2-like [Mya arenaria]|uniref:chitin synthase chs-2-like n=1 Tax=Mya arenaria TaxID=6604 RepID=UPI0022E824D4|nr:chitin synthase chs-2-like [Mya arenaria]